MVDTGSIVSSTGGSFAKLVLWLATAGTKEWLIIGGIVAAATFVFFVIGFYVMKSSSDLMAWLKIGFFLVVAFILAFIFFLWLHANDYRPLLSLMGGD